MICRQCQITYREKCYGIMIFSMIFCNITLIFGKDTIGYFLNLLWNSMHKETINFNKKIHSIEVETNLSVVQFTYLSIQDCSNQSNPQFKKFKDSLNCKLLWRIKLSLDDEANITSLGLRMPYSLQSTLMY